MWYIIAGSLEVFSIKLVEKENIYTRHTAKDFVRKHFCFGVSRNKRGGKVKDRRHIPSQSSIVIFLLLICIYIKNKNVLPAPAEAINQGITWISSCV